ncbi:motility protein A [Marinomonas mediterranea]|jgi:Flagellar motor component|uniref:MotA/TolQ/ExbB proton channel n=1 Tax=Marinomonas mediterranea (strain ATCC 700492 / JCM 21426 / NBRC 103028 / MMB-1) TaxID=717774 RepID=F2K3Y9_MARM1|nr:MotA/TolQ/ExbB proton channel family protein [Marinomonas mediterranea]ADZ91331.1 MotA/TolQ/ExbB proton channel [Marinomonas mediterranea MMB-1]WCN09301.1 motility protein A [Marinomonas mediterranea]WCN13383.1 motility protein A [Marinomonas mediterranea]WCN17451.1 motility protein A [Marinomonas mediterranea MMB-1]
MDFASFIGIISGLALIISAIFLGSSDIAIFLNIPGIMIVIGGTIAATLVTFQFKDTMSAFRAAFIVFSQDKQNPQAMIATMLQITKIARREGLVALSRVDADSPFLKRAMNMASDASDEDYIRKTLQADIDSLKMRHYVIQDVFKKMGLYAPAFGMLGTLIGLIQMLAQLDNPESIGPSMAVALLTTFYGSLLSTVIFNPIAGKLKARTILEIQTLEIIRDGTVSLLGSNNYLAVYERLSSYVPAHQRKPAGMGE